MTWRAISACPYGQGAWIDAKFWDWQPGGSAVYDAIARSLVGRCKLTPVLEAPGFIA